MVSFRSIVAVCTASCVGVASAAECTDAEWQTSQSIWSWAASTSACAQYDVGDSYVSAPCIAMSCVAIMEQVGEQLPDCTVGGVNNKIEVQNAMTVCNGEDLQPTDSPVGPTTTAPFMTSARITTISPGAANGAAPVLTFAPASGSTGTAGSSTTSVFSSSGSTGTSSDSALVTRGSSSSSNSSTTSCTTAQLDDIVSKYTTTAKTSQCAPDASINTCSIYVYTRCASSCATELKSLARDLPNCYVDFVSSNQKANLLASIDDCTTSSITTYISTTAYITTTTSSEASSTAMYPGLAVAILAIAWALLY